MRSEGCGRYPCLDENTFIGSRCLGSILMSGVGCYSRGKTWWVAGGVINGAPSSPAEPAEYAVDNGRDDLAKAGSVVTDPTGG